MIWRIIGWIVFIWVAIWVVRHPDQASTDFHNAWHVLFGSAGA